MPTLRIKLPDNGEITHELAADRISVGRRPDNTIQIVDPSVSGHHAELVAEDGHYRIHDLGSTNLTFVNGTAVTDFHLREVCRIAFGTMQCEFDPHAGSGAPRISLAQMEKDLTFLRGENNDLLGQIVALQRQIDILSSARLITKKVDNTPAAASNDSFKGIIAERDDLRHVASGLRLEIEKLRGDLVASVRELDAARIACERLQEEKVTQSRELQDLRKQGSSSPAPGGETPAPAPRQKMSPGDTAFVGAALASPAQETTLFPAPSALSTPAGVTLTETAELFSEPIPAQKPNLPLGPVFQAIAMPLHSLSTALSCLSLDIHEKQARGTLATEGGKLAHAATSLGSHPIVRLSLAIEGLLQEGVSRPDCLGQSQVRTLLQATELIGRLLDPQVHERGKGLPHPRVLAVDDDMDLLHTLAASLELTHLPTTTCEDSVAAQGLIEAEEYDLLLLDVSMPRLTGPVLCERIRQKSRNRLTPVIFLTVANTLDHRAQASLCGGNDFLPKPFNTAELIVKAETWIWKRRFDLL